MRKYTTWMKMVISNGLNSAVFLVKAESENNLGQETLSFEAMGTKCFLILNFA